MNINKPVKAGHLLEMLYWCVRNSKDLDNVPDLVKQLLTDNLWQKVYIESYDETVTYEKFEDFVTAIPPYGLGSTVDTLKRLCADTETLDLLDKEIQRGPGNPDFDFSNTKSINDYNIHNSLAKRPTGTGRQAGLRRLRAEIKKAETEEKRKEIKALQKQVFNNEISVHRALILIGARKETFTSPVDPEKAAKLIIKKFSMEQVKELIRLLQKN